MFTLAACSSENSKYKGVYSTDTDDKPTLEVPPNLSAPEYGHTFDLPERASSGTTYSSYQDQLSGDKKQTVLKPFKNARFVREGNLFWLELDANVDVVWVQLRDFFRKIGFEIKIEEAQLGIMETDWKESLAGVPTGWVSKWIGNVYSSGLMDKYRIHVERDTVKNKTLVFIAHRGVRESSSEDSAGDVSGVDLVTTDWHFRETDPELEIEMLMRFMAFTGINEAAAEKHIASVKKSEWLILSTDTDKPSLKIDEIFSRSWRHVGLALDRMGVLVEDRNRSEGVYYIKLPESFSLGEGDSWFSSDVKPESLTYILSVVNKGDAVWVVVKPRGDVKADLLNVSRKILSDIKDNIL